MPRNFYYNFVTGFIRAYTALMFRLDVRRHGELPPGPAIFVANHPSGMDPFVIHLLTRRHLSVLITESAFRVPVFGWLIHKCKQIPVVEGGGSEALETACAALRAGSSIGIFPEGAFSPQEGGFHPPRTGAARLALLSGAPVVPVGIYLQRERSVAIRSKISGKQTQGYWYLRGPYTMTIGEPMQFAGDVENREQVREIAQQIMLRIRTLARESEHRTPKPRLVRVTA